MKRTAYTAGSLYRTASARISLRWTAASGPDVTIIPSLGDRTNAATLCSMSAASRTLSGTSSMRSVGAIAWSTANWATAAVRPGSRSTATRVTCGAISLSSSSHLPLRHDWSPHDLRRTCATGMANLGIQPHVIECVLNHVSGFRGGVAGVYNKSPYEREVADALLRGSTHVPTLPGEPAGNLVPLPALTASTSPPGRGTARPLARSP